MWSITFSISLAALARIIWLTGLDRKKFRAQNAKCSLLWEGDTPLPDPPTARLLCSLAVILADKGFRRHGNIGHFQKRSLANYWDEWIWNVMLKARCYRLAPLLFGGNHILVIFAQNICIRNCFFGLKMQISPCPGRGTPPPRPPPPPLGRFAHSQFSSQITFGGFRRHGIYSFSYMSKISIWYFLIHDELLENCYEKNCHKSIQNKVDIALYRASRIPELPGPLSGPWTPAAIQGICFSPS